MIPSGRICPNCGEIRNFDLKEIQKGKWRVTCATCGHNDSEEKFTNVTIKD